MQKMHFKKTILAENILLITSLAIVFFTYIPSICCYFHADDFDNLSFAAQRGFSFSSFLIPIAQHFQPIARALFAAQYKLFGCKAEMYHWVNMLLHLTNTFLVFILFNSILRRKIYAICTSMLFGVSASCPSVVGWITTQGWLMATLCFLFSAILFVQYIQTKKKYLLAISCFFHFVMLLCFSSGLEVPLTFFLFVFIF